MTTVMLNGTMYNSKHGVEKKVPAAHMEIVTLEEHGAAKPKKKKAKEDAKVEKILSPKKLKNLK